jgi:hypothetical protein
LDSTKEQSGNRRPSGLGAPDCPVYTGQCPVHHRTVSGAPEDSNSNSPPSGISRGTRAIIHRTVRCTPDSVRCSKEARPQELASLGISLQPLHYNSPDCPVCTGLSGVPAEQRLPAAPTATCGAFIARSARAEHRRAHTGAPDNEQELSGVHRTPRRAHKSEAPTVRIQRQ